jgi:gas vesicle protein
MGSRAASQLLSGLVVGAALGATAALILASRGDVATGHSTAGTAGLTPFASANAALERAQRLLEEVRAQVAIAIDEGRKTAAQTRAELTRQFEEAKRGHGA